MNINKNKMLNYLIVFFIIFFGHLLSFLFVFYLCDARTILFYEFPNKYLLMTKIVYVISYIFLHLTFLYCGLYENKFIGEINDK